MNRQEMFDKAWAGAESKNWVKSSKKTVIELDFCYYRHPDDAMIRCNAGWLIPDELYDANFEGKRFTSEFFDNVMRHLEIDSIFDSVFVQSLQSAHDNSSGGEDHRNKMLDLAHEYALIVPSSNYDQLETKDTENE